LLPLIGNISIFVISCLRLLKIRINETLTRTIKVSCFPPGGTTCPVKREVVTLFAPPRRDFVAEFIPQSGAPQLLPLPSRQICNGRCTRTPDVCFAKSGQAHDAHLRLGQGRHSHLHVIKIQYILTVFWLRSTLHRDTRITHKVCTMTAKSAPPSSLRFVGARHTLLAPHDVRSAQSGSAT
jgi:hypothetical protein